MVYIPSMQIGPSLTERGDVDLDSTRRGRGWPLSIPFEDSSPSQIDQRGASEWRGILDAGDVWMGCIS